MRHINTILRDSEEFQNYTNTKTEVGCEHLILEPTDEKGDDLLRNTTLPPDICDYNT